MNDIAAGAITIGRNIGSRPMPRETWGRFVAAVEAVVRNRGGVVYIVASGIGEWDGQLEESVVVTFAQADMTAVMADLSQLAVTYGQDAIALLAGHTVLIGTKGAASAAVILAEATP